MSAGPLIVAVLVLGAIAAVAGWGMWCAVNGIIGEIAARSRRRGAGAHVPELDGSAAEMVRSWIKGRRCTSCGGLLVESRITGHHVALLDPGGLTREWVDVAADRLEVALATSLPVCWSCHVASTFRRLHPELVIDRDNAERQGDD